MTETKIHTPRPGNRALKGADEFWPLGHSAPKEPRALARVGSII